MRRALPDLLQTLAEMMASGVSLQDSVRYVQAGRTDRAVRAYLGRAAAGIEQGLPVSEVLSVDGDPWLGLLLKSGEVSGTLVDLLLRWSADERRRREWTAGLKKALGYPAMLTLSSVATLGLIRFVVLPRFEAMYASLGLAGQGDGRLGFRLLQSLPVAVGLCGAITVALYLSLPLLHRICPRGFAVLARNVPGVVLWRLWRTQQFASLIGRLVGAGIPLVESLAAASEAGPTWVRAAAGQIRQNLLDGVPLARAFVGDWDPILHLHIRLAELSGMLSDGLDRVDAHCRRELERRVQRILRRLEPSLTLATGGLIALTMLSLYVPMYTALSGMAVQ
ncbi:MAG: type II secretion system F family protein [Alicyclobacillus sp.]|nr:type II secretion system F family protein [Alicyclobacillus sp.]